MNDVRGTIKFGGGIEDNLFIGNRCDPSPPTIRTRASGYHYCINQYSKALGLRNHIINNVLNNTLSFRWKPVTKQGVFQGNVAVGRVYCTGTAKKLRKPDRIVLRNNVILGGVSWNKEAFGPGGPAGDWAAPDKVFINNVCSVGDPEAIAAARFADPAYLDYRLQSDSPLIGKALGGGDRGAFRRPPPGRILYVGPEGGDEAAGTSERLAFKTLARAASQLKAGDTLYVLPGKYAEALLVAAAGTPDAPIRVRALGKRRVVLPGIEVRGPHVSMEGFTVTGSSGDGIRVRAGHVTLETCRVYGNRAAGVRAEAAPDLSVLHCSLISNQRGIVLEKASSGATVRNGLIVANSEAAVALSEDSVPGYRGGHNCYSGPGLDMKRIEGEPHSIVADPHFVAASADDFRLKWDSPAAYLGELHRAAGAEPVLPRLAQITDVRVANAQRDSAVVLWQTPEDDTTGAVRYRAAGAGKWQSVADPDQGTAHGVGLIGLKPETPHEFEVVAENRRGRGASSGVRTFRTTAQARAPARFYVSPDGSDEADGRSPQTAWRTIRKANCEVRPGDILLAAPGAYHHAISPLCSGLPGKRITFKRYGQGKALIDGGGVLSTLVLLRKKHYITIDGFSLDCGPTTLVGSPTLIRLDSCKGTEILNCRPAETPSRAGAGIYATSCSSLRIEGNVLWGTRYHLRIFGCKDVLIMNNTFARKSVVSCQIGGGSGIRLINNLLYEPRSFRNAFLWLTCSQLASIVSDHNLFYATDKKLGVGLLVAGDRKGELAGADLGQWQEACGYDPHSVQADPMFVDAQKGDFRLRPGSPAIGVGQDGGNIGALDVAR